MANKNLSIDALRLVASRFKMLSEPIRLQILHKLQEGEASVNELADSISASQPNVSKHLKMLQAEGILSRDQKGNTVFYSISDESIFELCDMVCNSLESRLKSQASIFSDA